MNNSRVAIIDGNQPLPTILNNGVVLGNNELVTNRLFKESVHAAVFEVEKNKAIFSSTMILAICWNGVAKYSHADAHKADDTTDIWQADVADPVQHVPSGTG
ncbi:Proteasome subunit alpha [Trichinella pseudospiralis]